VHSAANLLLRRLTRVAVGVGVLLVGAAGPAGGTPPSAAEGTLVFASNRTGISQIYSIRADGTQLGQLTRGKATDTAPRFSPDGRRIVFTRSPKQYTHDLWVMNADGGGQRRLAVGAGTPTWSPDSRRIAYATDVPRVVIQDVDGGRTVTISGRNGSPYWSPDGRLIALSHRVGDRGDLAVVRSDGSGLKALRRNAAPLGWSRKGEIAFTVLNWQAIGVMHPDGRGARRLLPFSVNALAWSPDGRRLASVGGPLPRTGLHLSAASGTGVRDIEPQLVNEIDPPDWSPDSRWVATSYAPNGSTLRRLLLVAADASATRPLLVPAPWGANFGAPSWRPRGATPERLGRAPVAVPTDVVTSTSFAPALGRISEIAADGGLAAVVIRATPRICAGVLTWEPSRKRSTRLHFEDCIDKGVQYAPAQGLAVAGRHVAWFSTSGGNTLETAVTTATPEQPSEATLAYEAAQENGVPRVTSRPVGHSSLLAFTVTHRCSDGGLAADACPPGLSEGDIVDATIWRLGGSKRCPKSPSGPTCTVVARADGRLLVLATDGRRIAALSNDGVRLLSASGSVLRDFPVEATAAALSGTHLALRTGNGVEIYDTGSAKLTKRLSAATAVELADLSGDILVTTSAANVTLRSLADGRTLTLHTVGTARAKLTDKGLFLAGARRVTFMPLQDIQRRLRG
jgi:Tol biopolymer transport system component